MKKSLFLALMASLPVHANSVSWNLDNNSTIGGNGAGDLPTSPALAGLNPTDHWTNSWPSNLTTNLRDDAGNPTTVDIVYASANGSWSMTGSHPGQDQDGSWNKEMLNGYLNAGNGGTSSVTFSEIPYTSYDIIVYFSSDVIDREGSVTDGTTTYYFRTLGNASVAGSNAVLTPATDMVDDAQDDPANYAVFTGLSGTSQTVTVEVPTFGGIAAIQIVNGALPGSPTILQEPQDQSAAVNQTATFFISVAGDPAPTYQWQFSADGITGWEDLPFETDASLVLFGIDFADVGYYRVISENLNGDITSQAAFLEVFFATPDFFEQPADTFAETGGTVQLSADAFTYGNPSYQWYKNGEVLPGEISTTLVLAGVDATDEGEYFLRVTDDIEPDLFGDSETVQISVFEPWDGLVSHDPFDTAAGYAVGELPLQDPGVAGYTGPWSDIDFGDAEPGVIETSLVYPNPLYLGSSGARVGKAADAEGLTATNSGRTYRLLQPRLVANDSTTGVRYLSWIYRNGNENAAPAPTIYSTLALYNGDTNDLNRTFEGGVADDAFGANLFFRVNNSDELDTGVAADGGVHLFVAKFEFSADTGSDTVTVWLDPTLGGGDPTGGQVVEFKDLAFDRIVLSDYASNSADWDEIRWGSTFDSVTLNPDPADDFAAWIALYPGVGERDGFNDDPDGDGLENGVENYFGTDPSAGNPGITAIARSGSQLSFQHPISSQAASDISAAYQWSLDLQNWNADGSTVSGVTVDFDQVVSGGTVSVTADLSGTIPARCFTRIQVSHSAP